MAVLSSFEILSETLVPKGILPPTAENPYLIQGYWLQISLAPGAAVQSAFYNIIFQETTKFTQGSGQKSLQAQLIDQNGNVNIYPNSLFFASTGIGFLNQQIGFGQTIIYGIQCLTPPSQLAALPQNGTGWRGTVQISGQQPGSLIATPTQRLVYYNGTDITKVPVVDAVVYAVPTFSGGTQI